MLLPNHEMIVSARLLTQTHVHSSGLIEATHSSLEKNGIMVAKTLVNMKNPNVKVSH